LLLSVLLLTGIAAMARADFVLDVNPLGIGRAIADGPRTTPLETNVLFFQNGYKTTTGFWQWNAATSRPTTQSIDFVGPLKLGEQTVSVTQSVINEGNEAYLRIRLFTETDVDLDEAILFLSVPVPLYAGSVVQVDEVAPTTLPSTHRSKTIIEGDQRQSAELRALDGTVIRARFDRPANTFVQDGREFGDDKFNLCVQLVSGPMRRNQYVEFGVRLSADIPEDHTPAVIRIDRDHKLQSVTGIGGSFVYGTDSPVVQRNLDSLPLAITRTGMDLREWEPLNDNADPAQVDRSLGGRDIAGSDLRKRFELDRKLLTQSSGQLIASVWYLPEWLYDEPIRTPGKWRDTAGTVARAKWPELAECLASYLLHQKQVYGVEPIAFSFNEPDYGVYLKLTGEEYRDLVKFLAERFARDGLKTKFVLNDSASAKNGIDLIKPSLADPEAMKHFIALAYHGWVEEPAGWKHFAEVSQQTNLPVWVLEVGADPLSWKDDSFNDTRNWLIETRRMLNLINVGRASVLIQWEWSDDFSLWQRKPGSTDPLELAPTPRWRTMRAITKYLPASAQAVAVESDNPHVTAALLESADRTNAVLHLVNTGDERTVTISGDDRFKRAIVLTEQADAQQDVASTDGKITLTLPAQSHVLLTSRQSD
jgi:O-glycosyl hydrolase